MVEASNSFEAYEQFLSEYFFEHKRIKIVASEYKNNEEAAINELRIKIGNEPEFPIYQLGTGLQMVILLTLPLFECKSGVICIEEPELFLHPGLQKQLLEVFASDDENLPFRDSVFFLSTHSNHIIDSQFSENKRSIFTVQKILNDERNVKFRITNLAYRQKDALHLLGVTNTSVYLANCTIWVEGVTDRLYLSAFMRAFLGYIKKCQEENTKPDLVKEFKNCLPYREGTHYAFVFSGGDNIIHWDFDDDEWDQHKKQIIVRDICGRAFVIVDNDNGKNPERKQNLKELLTEERFEELCVSEMENFLPLEAIEAGILHYPTFKNFTLGLNSQAHTSLRKKLLDKEMKLGRFIEEMLEEKRKTITDFPKKKFSEESGTVRDKVNFCTQALGENGANITYENMTEECKNLVRKVLTFIMKQNASI